MTDAVNSYQGEKRHLAPGLTEEATLAKRVFVRGQGSRVYDHNDEIYIDFGAGVLTQAVGHCHPRVTASVQEQLARLTNIHDSSTPQRDHLCSLLASMFPSYLSRFAFFSSGAEAVEAAIRAVHAYEPSGRTVIASLRSGFHGKTAGARALVKWRIGSEDIGVNARQLHRAHCYKCPLDLKYPDCSIACANQVANEILESDNIAALLFEPIQSAGGVIVPPLDYWKIIEAACRKKNIIMVADEIVTAGGRAGTFLACQYYGIEPDLVTAAKGISSGLPFSLLAGREDIMCSPRFSTPGSISSTFGGNPVSCAAASATLEVIRDEDLLVGVPVLGAQMTKRLNDLRERFPENIADVRGIGLLHAIEFGRRDETDKQKAARAARFYQDCLRLGVRVGLGGNIARLSPPLNISAEDIDLAADIMGAALSVDDL
jgi:4-aminobutyrate aminotransferase-like enzyme